jgi:hypothetical protein
MACITEAAVGFPNASGTIPPGNGIKRVAVDVSGQPYVDLKREAAAMLARG